MKYTDKDIIMVLRVLSYVLDIIEFDLDVIEVDSEIPDTQELKFELVNRPCAEVTIHSNLGEVLYDKLSAYCDWLYDSFDERVVAEDEVIPAYDWDKLVVMFLEHEYCKDLLTYITPCIYSEYVSTGYGYNYKNRLNEYDDIIDDKNMNELTYLINKEIAHKIIDTMSAYKMAEYNGSIYLSDYNAPFDSNEDFLKALKKNDYSQNEFFIKCNDYSQIIGCQIPQVWDDMNELGLTEEYEVDAEGLGVNCNVIRGWSFYLSTDELDYIGFDKSVIDYINQESYTNTHYCTNCNTTLLPVPFLVTQIVDDKGYSKIKSVNHWNIDPFYNTKLTEKNFIFMGCPYCKTNENLVRLNHNINKLAIQIKHFLTKYNLWDKVCIYYNGWCLDSADNPTSSYHDVVKTCNPNFEDYNPLTLSMEYENNLQYILYYDSNSEIKKEFIKLLTEYNLYYEVKDYNCLTCYYFDHETDFNLDE